MQSARTEERQVPEGAQGPRLLRRRRHLQRGRPSGGEITVADGWEMSPVPRHEARTALFRF